VVIKAILNTLFLPLWTVFMVSFAVSRVVLQRDPGIFRRLQRNWGKGIADFCGFRVTIHGAEHMEPGCSYVVVSNHQSHMDIPIIFMTLPTTPGFVAKKELMKVPFLAKALDMGGHVIVDRSDRQSAHQSLEQAADEIRGGKTVLIFPEGTRGATEEIYKFKGGAFHMAKGAGVPILPVGLRGTRKLFPKEGMLIRGGAVEVHIGEPIAPEEIADADLKTVSATVRERIAALADMPLLSK